MLKFYKISSYLLLCLNILLIFLLIFESKVSLPLAMSPLGRMHPLLLHIPIGFSVFLVLLYFIRNEIDQNSYQKISKLLLTITSLSLSIVALMGFFLSKEGGFEEGDLGIHKWTGVASSIFSFGLILFYDKIKFHLNSSGSWTLLIFLMVAGHFGASITHGKNYLFEAIESKKTKPVFTEANSLYSAAVFPILEAKCINCHNDQKSKGQLNMSSIQKILKGGKNGPIWKATDALNSHIIQRAMLPINDKKHMPPVGKSQLTEPEIAILTNWINEGADLQKAIKDYQATSKSKLLAMNTLNTAAVVKEEKVYTFTAASEAKVKEVNTPFCTVFPIANNSPALEADFYVSKKFEIKSLENLSKVGEQIVVLNLSKMPIKDENISSIAKFKNLEKLTLNQTDITGATLDQLKNCKNLNSLAVSGTKIIVPNLEKLLSHPSLKEIFIWDTPISNPQLEDLAKKYPKIKFEKGAVSNPNEILQLNPPALVNEDFVLKGSATIVLKHSLRNVKILYTIDGTEPDSATKNIYTNPIKSDGSLKLKAVAVKEGWYASKKVAYQFFKSSYTPDSVYLLNTPSPKYTKGGGKSLIDLKKGLIDNTDNGWLGFTDDNFNTLFEFKEAKPIKSVTISFLKKLDPFIFPPTSIEIWAGNSKNSLKLLQKNNPNQPQKGESSEIVGIDFNLPTGLYKYVKVVAKPIQKLPSWHAGKGKKGWVFIDEVLFN
ncbi:MAG: chitobiase/beta-hexosaminidase C-terminal domain-containing protein [Bacteroidota bacterium]